jgi:hypothetical protein
MTKFKVLILLYVAILVFQGCQNMPATVIDAVSFDEPEAPQPVSPAQDWDALIEGIHASWANGNERYHREYIPRIKIEDNQMLTGWRNERLNAQLVVWSKDPLLDLQVEVSDLICNEESISSDAVKSYFVRNVLSDEFLGGCGYKTKDPETAHLVADCLEDIETFNMSARSVRGIWFTIDIPKDAAPGLYSAELILTSGGEEPLTLTMDVEVQDRVLPDPSDWTYHLDLWQNPFAVARVHELELWSDEHFAAMRPLYEMLAGAGQKCITASILHRPWGGQTLDHFETMIEHTLKEDGGWEYDYSIFDTWVSFMMDLGIREQINCYSLIPWGNQLWYYDESLGTDTFMVATASTSEFADYWTPFLEDFSEHLKGKGWYDIATIAMDERPQEDMLSAIELIQEFAGLKITSAANYSPGTSEHVYDLSVAPGHILEDEVLEQRRQKGQLTTYYVCCADEFPNNFTYSPPAEGVWQAWYAFAKKQDGFLRWAYNSWVEDPVHDSRFRTWPAGDTYFVYPGPKSSIRWEKLREGIQDFEKLRILSEELVQSGTAEAKIKLQQLEDLLMEFETENIRKEGAEKAVLKGKALLDDLSGT